MITTIIYNDGKVEKDLPDDENIFFKEIGQFINKLPIPNYVIVKCEKGENEYNVIKKGGTMFVKRENCSIKFEKKGNYPSTYLTCIDVKDNHYKFYKLENDNDMLKVTYGRIGAEAGTPFGEKNYTYPSDMYWIKYYEKMQKGYEDKSKIYLAERSKKNNNKKNNKKNENNDKNKKAILETGPSYELFNLLKLYAKNYVYESCVSTNVTIDMVNESKKILKLLYNRKTVNGFNRQLLNLIAICPRKVNYVEDLIAKTKEDFPIIIDREESLVSAMEVLVSNTSNINNNPDSFQKWGIEVYEATNEQKQEVYSHLNDNLKNKVYKIYRVINKNKQNDFNNYVKNKNITTIKQFWHGSKNENWLSIIKNGLLLNPNAVITGKMFGNGIYFAPSCQKSWNYTSYRGTSWANGKSDMGIMGLYATAYGEPLNVTCSHHYTERELGNKNCVHAHAGIQLRNDEIIFYNENAMILNYIVEFR